MDPSDILPIVQQSINLKAVALAVILTKFVKYWLPSPGLERSTKMIPGHISTRILPFLPILFGVVFCGLIERDSTYVMEDVIRGIFSGAMAAYSYRAVKVSFLGE
jgi:hypothetical protein